MSFLFVCLPVYLCRQSVILSLCEFINPCLLYQKFFGIKLQIAFLAFFLTFPFGRNFSYFFDSFIIWLNFVKCPVHKIEDYIEQGDWDFSSDLYSVNQNLERRIVFHQLENSQDPDDAQRQDGAQYVGGAVAGDDGLDDDGREVRQKAQNVDDVEGPAEELHLLWREADTH